jgi:hypothetical protein
MDKPTINTGGFGKPYALPQIAPRDAEVIYRRFSEALAENVAAPDVLSWECTETVFNRPASMRDIRKRLRALPLHETLEILGTIDVEIARGRTPIDAVLQVRVAIRLGDQSRRARALVRRLIDTPHSVLVDEEQIGMLSAMAVKYCEANAWTEASGMALLEALLAFHSVKGAELHDEETDDYTAFRRIELRGTSVDPEKITDVIRRWTAFIDWSKTAEARASGNFIDVDALCADALGMSYTEWVTAAWAFTIPFTIIQSAPDGSRRYDPFIDPQRTIKSFAQHAQLEHFFAAASIDLNTAKNRLDTIITTSLSELEVFMERPLVTTDFGTCCPVPRFLPALAGNALIFRLGSYLDGHGGGSGRLRAFWGEFLESYVFDLVSAATNQNAAQLFREKKYGTPEKKSSDVSIFTGNAAVFIDVTATRFRLRDSVVGLDDQAAEEDLERFIVHKIRDEVARCARDFRAGELQFAGIDSAAIDRIYALAVSPQSVPRMIGITESLDRMMPGVPNGLTQWDFFDLNEIEFLATAFPGDLNLADVIAAKRADEFGRRRSVTNYLYFKNRALFRVAGDPNERPAEPWFERIKAQLRAWGLRGG